MKCKARINLILALAKWQAHWGLCLANVGFEGAFVHIGQLIYPCTEKNSLLCKNQNFSPHLKHRNSPPSQLSSSSSEPWPESGHILTPHATSQPHPAVRDCAPPLATAQPRKPAKSRAIAAKLGLGSAGFRQRDVLLARSRGEKLELG